MKTRGRYIAKVPKRKQGSKVEPAEGNERVNQRINHNMDFKVIGIQS